MADSPEEVRHDAGIRDRTANPGSAPPGAARRLEKVTAVNKGQWQKLAERWLEDAKALLDEERWPAAYYLAGYAVECGLKACVLVRVAAEPQVVIDEKRFSDKCRTHSVQQLLEAAGLKSARAQDAAADPLFGKNWMVAKDWSEESRYRNTTRQKAEKLHAAITDPANGVMQWIRKHW
jgi:HEPN domain-containing protein